MDRLARLDGLEWINWIQETIQDTIVVPDNGEGLALQYFVNKAAPQDLRLRLFQNNITPAETDLDTTYTEATFGGYAGITLTGANWTLTTGAPSFVAYAQQSFTSNAAQTTQNIYGYYMTRVAAGDIALAERFPDGPYPIANNGDVIRITPRIEAS